MNEFHPGSILHLAVLLILAGLCALLIQTGKAARQQSKASGIAMDRWFAVVLAILWVVLASLDLLPGNFRWNKSLPLHICDVTGIFAPIALWTNRRWARSMLFFWGVGMCSQAFVLPMLYLGPAHLDFWTFMLCHSAIVCAAVYDLGVRGFRPTWSDWKAAVEISAIYALLVLPVNIRLGVNYGFLGRTDFAQPFVVLASGSWPARVPRVVALVWAWMALFVPLGNIGRVRHPGMVMDSLPAV